MDLLNKMCNGDWKLMIKIWKNNFIKEMKPKYLPEYFKLNIDSDEEQNQCNCEEQLKKKR